MSNTINKGLTLVARLELRKKYSVCLGDKKEIVPKAFLIYSATLVFPVPVRSIMSRLAIRVKA
ncbi:MAG: hypothetical protein NTX14_03350, partial [Candidatus Nealsonbacteria bacterium]|nr:hypothetical protein [Candidatus Nealsonbacteria bacterium]